MCWPGQAWSGSRSGSWRQHFSLGAHLSATACCCRAVSLTPDFLQVWDKHMGGLKAAALGIAGGWLQMERPRC